MTLTGRLTSSGMPHVPPSDLPTRIFTASNLLSVLRAFLALPFVLVMLSQTPASRLWGAAIMIIAALTDKIDGMLARKLHQTSEWGRIFDPLADKIALAACVIVLLLLQEIPPWFVIAILLRDLLIFAGGMYLKATRGLILPSNEAGKWTVGILALTLFGLVIGIQAPLSDAMILASLVMIIISFLLYVKRFVEVLGIREVSS